MLKEFSKIYISITFRKEYSCNNFSVTLLIQSVREDAHTHTQLKVKD